MTRHVIVSRTKGYDGLERNPSFYPALANERATVLELDYKLGTLREVLNRHDGLGTFEWNHDVCRLMDDLFVWWYPGLEVREMLDTLRQNG